MLEDFIEDGKFDAKIFLSEDEILSPSQISKICNLPESEIIKVVIYIGSDKKPVLAILPQDKEADLGKISKIMGCERIIREAIPPEVEGLTGYRKGVLPPISIYGIDIIIEKSIMDKGKVACFGGTKNSVVVLNPKCIIESAWEEPKVEEISK